MDRIAQELKIHQLANHNNVIQYKGHFFDLEGNLCIKLEKMSKTLETRIQEEAKTGEHFPEWKLWHYFIQLAKGVYYLNMANIIHMDIKADNILINDETKELKLSDFGTSKKFEEDEPSICISGLATPLTASPEMIKGEAFGRRNDTWALGCILY